MRKNWARRNYRSGRKGNFTAAVIAALLFIPLFFQGCGNQTVPVQEPEELPDPALAFLEEYYPGVEIDSIVVHKVLLKDDTYSVSLNDGTEIDFNSWGDWEKTAFATGSRSPSVLPDNTRQYIDNEYPEEKIVSVERELKGFLVVFENGERVRFDRQGEFREADESAVTDSLPTHPEP